jgi:UDP-glucose 4-epimerase
MKALVFGGSGFLGSYVVDALFAEGHDVFVFDVKESKYLEDKGRMKVGDILNPKDVADALQGADIVYNFAAIADLDDCIRQPVDAVRYNILGNTIILDACVKAKVKRFLFASTVYVYSTAGGFYRSTKQACESLIEDYHKYYGLDFTILRYGTPYGPRADARNSVYRILHQALEKGKIEYPGDGSELREYIHASDCARLSIEALDDRYRNERVVLTGHHGIRVSDLFMMVNEILGGNIRIEYSSNSKQSKSIEPHYRITPYSYSPKIAKKLVNHYYLDLGQGLLECIEEMRNQLNAEELRHQLIA